MMTRKRCLSALVMFIIVGAVHVGWFLWSTQSMAGGSEWASLSDEVAPGFAERLGDYVSQKQVFMGYSYALSAGFMTLVLCSILAGRKGATVTASAGGATLGAIFAALGCFLSGCCGSPMLAVYVSLFGARVAGFTEPLVAGVTTIMVAASWWWMSRRGLKASSTGRNCCRTKPLQEKHERF